MEMELQSTYVNLSAKIAHIFDKNRFLSIFTHRFPFPLHGISVIKAAHFTEYVFCFS